MKQIIQFSILLACLFIFSPELAAKKRSTATGETLTKSIQHPVTKGYKGYAMHDMGKYGFVVIATSPKFGGIGKKLMKVWRYKTNMRLVDSTTFKIPNGYYFTQAKSEKDQLVMVFLQFKTFGTPMGTVAQFPWPKARLYNLNITRMEGNPLKPRFPLITGIKDWTISDGYAYFLSQRFAKGFVHSINLETKSRKKFIVKRKLFFKSTFVLGLDVDPVSKDVNVVYNRKKGFTNKYFLRVYRKGDFVEEVALGKIRKIAWVDAHVTKVGENEYNINGTYVKERSIQFLPSSMTGVFTSSSKDGQMVYSKYSVFKSIKDLYSSYMGRVPKFGLFKWWKFKYMGWTMEHHTSTKIGDDTYVVGEAYYPIMRYFGISIFNRNEEAYPYIGSQYKGKQSILLMVSKIGKDGSQLWTQTFPMKTNQTSWLTKKYAKALISKKGISVVYPNGGDIEYRKISLDGKVEANETFGYEAKVNGKSVKNEVNFIDHWYKSYFLHFSYPKYKSKPGKKGQKITITKIGLKGSGKPSKKRKRKKTGKKK